MRSAYLPIALSSLLFAPVFLGTLIVLMGLLTQKLISGKDALILAMVFALLFLLLTLHFQSYARRWKAAEKIL